MYGTNLGHKALRRQAPPRDRCAVSLEATASLDIFRIILTHMKHDDLLRCRTADGGLRREKSLTAWETTLDPRYMDSSRPADVLFCEQIARSAFTALRTGVS